MEPAAAILAGDPDPDGHPEQPKKKRKKHHSRRVSQSYSPAEADFLYELVSMIARGADTRTIARQPLFAKIMHKARTLKARSNLIRQKR